MTEGTARAWESDPLALIGREAALAGIGSLLTRPPRTAVVLGFPGQGKSVLLGAVGRGWADGGGTVATITGRGSPVGMPAVAVELQEVPQDGADLLEWLGDRHRVLVLVDDASGIDARGTAALQRAVSTLADREVSVLYASRDTPPPGVDERLCVLLDPLDDQQSVDLLRRAGIAVNAFVKTDLLERAAGNPRALLELGRLAQTQGPRGTRVPDVLTSVEADLAAGLVGLPAQTRHVLLLAAAGGDELARLLHILDEPELLSALAPAETQRLIRVIGRRVVFPHSLARTAVYGSATTAERVAAHRSLAAAFADDPDARLRHLAAAALSPDEAVASALMESAARAHSRWALTEAARLRAQAAQLTPDPDLRADRLLHALATVLPTGNLAWLDELATQLRDDSSSVSIRSRADHFRAYALAHTFEQDAARMTLTEAVEGLLTVATDDGWEALSTLATVVYQTDRGVEALAGWFRRYRGHSPVRDALASRLIEASDAWISAVIDPADRRQELLTLVRTEPNAEPLLPAEAVAAISLSLGSAAWLLEESSVGRRHLRCAVDLMSRARVPGKLAQATMTLAQVDFDLAEYDAVTRGARRLIAHGAIEGLPHLRLIGLDLEARVAAVRGEIEAALPLVDEVLHGLGTGQMRALAADVRRTQAFVCFAQHDATGCLEHLRSLYDRHGLPVHRHASDRALADLVSAAVRVGRGEEVRLVVESAHARIRDPGRRQGLMLARCDALLAGADAEPYHQRAVGAPGGDEWPFDLANAYLEYGNWLRRHHRPGDARSHLRTALDHFEQLGTRPWAELARSELRAAGVLLGDRRASTWQGLTHQERQVVDLAAAGLTNREIGASLYLSPRTVGAHLYNAFPKLGVTARSQLRDVVERHAAED